MSKPVVLVLGASGQVGTAAVNCLVDKYASKLVIRAGTRDPESAQHLSRLSGVEVVKAATGDEEHLSQALVGVDILCIIPPTLPNVADLVRTTVEQAKKAGVKHIISVTAYYTDRARHLLFDKWAHDTASCLETSAIPYTIIPLPVFFENYCLFDHKSITEKGEIVRPHAADRRFDAIAVSDIGKALAAIINEPERYTNRVMYLVGNLHSVGQVAKKLTEVLGREVSAKEVSKEEYHQSLLEMATPLELADAVTEFLDLIRSDSAYSGEGDPGVLKELIGEEPEDVESWIDKNVKNFLQ